MCQSRGQDLPAQPTENAFRTSCRTQQLDARRPPETAQKSSGCTALSCMPLLRSSAALSAFLSHCCLLASNRNARRALRQRIKDQTLSDDKASVKERLLYSPLCRTPSMECKGVRGRSAFGSRADRRWTDGSSEQAAQVHQAANAHSGQP